MGNLQLEIKSEIVLVDIIGKLEVEVNGKKHMHDVYLTTLTYEDFKSLIEAKKNKS